MANTREIQERISSIEDTRKITNAMYLISSTKLQKARRNLEDTEPFFFGMEAMIARMLRHVPDLNNKYFSKSQEEDDRNPDRRRGYIVVTADKGLAGAYNHNVLKMAEKLMEDDNNFRLYVVGEAGRQYFTTKGIPIDEHFQYTAQNPNLGRARIICNKILADYNAHEIDEVYVIYTRMLNSMTVEAEFQRLLPLYRSDFDEEHKIPLDVRREDFTFEPSLDAVLDNCVPNYVGGFIYAALVESFCSEQNARMVAMQAANDSSAAMLHDLNIQFNRVRQAQITQQITEVIGGARAQKRKKSQG